uniref:SFRICE003510.2 n=1 Tax=Spodoptera frugiperda TaxID=7108 RepID=A0A2H1VMK5_SPOFR
MRALHLVVLFLHTVNCLEIEIPQRVYTDKLLKCSLDIIKKYFTETKVMTYVGSKVHDKELLQAIHDMNLVSMVSKRADSKVPVPHQGYLICAKNFTHFVEHFSNIIKEATWNPNARFLFIVRELTYAKLKTIFDITLKLHVNDVVVVNSTDDADLYTYNPFDNYNCGKRYDDIISYGKCSEADSINLYPNKFVTGLRNCTFRVWTTQWPPYTMVPEANSTDPFLLKHGVEPYLLSLMGEMLGFDLDIIGHKDITDDFPTVSKDMEAIGSLKRIQDNEVDIVVGGMLLVPSRAAAFFYVYGHQVYTDEIRFVVRRATEEPAWKNVYLEFSTTVWVLLLLTLVLYSVILIILLRAADKGYIVLILLDILVLHGRNIRSRWMVKMVLLSWVLFAYLVNVFYQSNLVSLTTNPVLQYQISNEEDIFKYNLKPCLSLIMGRYYIESVQSDREYDMDSGCYGLMESVETVSKSDNLFALLLYAIYQYYEDDYFDEYGDPRVVTVSKPYSKVIYTFYLYKGFPLIHDLCQKCLQLRENGLVDKAMRDLNFLKKIKHTFRQSQFQPRFAVPWIVYVFGCTISIVTFTIELLSKY